jgi:hypothetical protein
MCHDDIAMMDMEGIMVYDCIRGSGFLVWGFVVAARDQDGVDPVATSVMPQPSISFVLILRAPLFLEFSYRCFLSHVMHSSNEMPCPSFSVSETFRPGENQQLCPVSGSVISSSSLPSGAAGLGWKRPGTPH